MIFHKGQYIQKGFGLRHNIVQSGAGVGGLFSTIMRYILPVLKGVAKNVTTRVVKSTTAKNVVRAVKQSAIEGGITLAKDILRGGNVKASIRKGVKKIKDDTKNVLVKEKVKRTLTRGIKKVGRDVMIASSRNASRSTKKRTNLKTLRRARSRDIFD